MSTKSVWLSIWVNPRATIRRIVIEDPNKNLWTLAAIYGFSSLLNSFQSLALGTMMGIIPIFLIALILSPIWGYIVFNVWSWVISFTGRWLKGQGDFQSIRAAYAWSCVPILITDVLWIFTIIVFGTSLFIPVVSDAVLPTGLAMLLLSVAFIKVVLSIWSLVIYLNALAEVQQFSIFRAIGNVIITFIIVGVVLGVVWGISMYALGVPEQPSYNANAAFQVLQEGKVFLLSSPGSAL